MARAQQHDDGRADLASADPADAAVVVLLGTGQGGSFKSRVLYPSGFPNRAITTADLNGDGRLDLVTANAAANGGPGGTTLSVLLGNGDGTFQPFTVVSLPRFTGRAIAAADFDHDGRMDLALGTQSFSTSGILTLKGNGDGTFAPAFYYPTSSNAPNLSATLYFTLGDLNGDGRPDVVAGNRRFDANFVQTGADITVLLDQADGSLVNSGTTAVHFAEGLAVADFDSNGLPDVASDDCIQLQNASPTPAAVTALLSPAGGGSVAPRLAVSFAPNPWRDAGAVTFVLARTGRVSLGLYDLNGRRVASLLDGARLEAGEHRVAIARRPEGVGPGVYFYRLWTETGSATTRAVLTAR